MTPTPTSRWRPTGPTPGSPTASPTACQPARPRSWLATQRPIAFSAFTKTSGPPAWKTIPSWAVIGTADHAIPPAELLFMAHRAHAHVTQINAGHLTLITSPGAVARVIIDAADATTG